MTAAGRHADVVIEGDLEIFVRKKMCKRDCLNGPSVEHHEIFLATCILGDKVPVLCSQINYRPLERAL